MEWNEMGWDEIMEWDGMKSNFRFQKFNTNQKILSFVSVQSSSAMVSSSSASLFCGNPFVLRTLSPVSLDHGFLYLHLSSSSPQIIDSVKTIDLQSNLDAMTTSTNFNYCQYYSLDLLDHYCLLLSRLVSASARISSEIKDFDVDPANVFVAFPYNHKTVSVVFPADRKREVHQILQEASFNEGGMFSTGIAMQEAFTCGLREALVRDGWIVCEGNLAVWSGSDRTQWLNSEPTEVVEFNIQTDTSNRINFFLSPDVIRFRPFKMVELLSEPLKKAFSDGSKVILDKWLENMAPDDMQKVKCIVFPSMREGFVSGCCKSAPEDVDVKKLEEILAEKFGPINPRGRFYIQVSFSCEEDVIRVWFPSYLVLQRPGLIVTPPSVRKSKVFSALEKIISSISRWNFFNIGTLHIINAIVEDKESTSSNWTTAKSIPVQDSLLREDKEIFDIRSSVRNLEAAFLQSIRRQKPMSFQTDIADEIIESSIPETLVEKANLPYNMRIPIFQKKKSRGNGVITEYHKEPNSENLGTKLLKKHEELQYDTTSVSSNLEAAELLGKKKMINVCFPSRNEKKYVSKSIKAQPPAGSKLKPNLVIKNGDIVKSGGKTSSGNGSSKENVVSRKKVFKCDSQEKQSSAQQHKKNKVSKSLQENLRKKPQAVLNPLKDREDIQITVSSNGNAAMMVSPPANIASIIVSPQANMDSMIVSPQENMDSMIVSPQANMDSMIVSLQDNNASMIVCPQDNVHFTPIKEYISVGKLPENPKEKKPAKQIEKKSTADLNIHGIKQKIFSKCSEGKLNVLTVPELKCFLSANKTKVSGRKEELIQRVLLIVKGTPI